MIGLVFIGNIEFCPYLENYESLLRDFDIEYRVLFWERSIYTDYHNEKYIKFDYPSSLRKNKLNKFFDFYKYRKWLLSKMHEYNFEKIIILDTLSGVLLRKYIVKQKRHNYIYEIRDYSYENIYFFRLLESSIIKNAYYTFISSRGFLEFLPKYRYNVAHNFNYDEYKAALNCKFHKKEINDILNIVWIGSIRYYDLQVRLINLFKNDSRFRVIYHGIGPDYERTKEYAKDTNCSNIIFTGKYNNSEKDKLLKNADLLLNVYDNKVGNEVKYAISNKFYDGMIYKIPQLVESGTYKAKKTFEYSIGLPLDLDHIQSTEIIFKFYHSINARNFEKSCENALKNIINESLEYNNNIINFIKEVGI